MKNIYKDVLFGVAIGDALGVPVEFTPRDVLVLKPVTDMIGYGTYNLPPGTFSDDSSLTFCLAEALTFGFDVQKIANNFISWLKDGYWTPLGNVFDIGIATRKAIRKLQAGYKPELAGGEEEIENGNGSLMRVLPLLFYIKDKRIEERYQITNQISSITHRHIRSIIACFYYLEFARNLLNEGDKFTAYRKTQTDVLQYLNLINVDKNELNLFGRLLNNDIFELAEKDIYSSGYVLHTLEASIWCLLTTDSYGSATLKAVNLGSDTDTTGAVTGGLAGLTYGWSSIPELWIRQLARKNDIDDLARRLQTFANT